MRRRALPSALGALGQRTERRMLSLVMELSRASNSATVPLKPSSRVLKNEVDSRLSGVGREVDGFKGIDWVLEVGVGWWKW